MIPSHTHNTIRTHYWIQQLSPQKYKYKLDSQVPTRTRSNHPSHLQKSFVNFPFTTFNLEGECSFSCWGVRWTRPWTLCWEGTSKVFLFLGNGTLQSRSCIYQKQNRTCLPNTLTYHNMYLYMHSSEITSFLKMDASSAVCKPSVSW